MGMLPSSKQQAATPANIKRRSGQLDFANLGPLKTTGTVGFSAFRDHNEEPSRKKSSRKGSKSGALGSMEEDSDEDDDDDDHVPAKMEDEDDKDDSKTDKSKLGPEDAQFSGELADGVKRIRVRSFLPLYPLYRVLTVGYSSREPTPPTQTAPAQVANHPAPAPQRPHHPSKQQPHHQPLLQ